MPSIEGVDYVDLAERAKKIHTHGFLFYKQMNIIFTKVNAMKISWKGVRYNTLIGKLNPIIPSVISMSKLVNNEIPTALSKVATNYKNVDTASNDSPEVYDNFDLTVFCNVKYSVVYISLFMLITSFVLSWKRPYLKCPTNKTTVVIIAALAKINKPSLMYLVFLDF